MISKNAEKILLKQERAMLLKSNLSNSKVRVEVINKRLAQIKAIESKKEGKI